MATDPVQQIHHEKSDSPLTFGVQAALKRLADLSPSPDLPYVTLSLDWRVSGEHPGWDYSEELDKSQRYHDVDPEENFNRRPSWRTMERELDARIEDHGPRGEIFDSLSADKERIESWLEHDLDPSAQGVFIVACSARGVFETVSLSLPVDTGLEIGPTPSLSVIAHMVDDHPPYAVLHANQQDARLTIVRRAQEGVQVTVEGDEYPRKQAQGGWSQRRYQSRADERIEAFAREVGEQTRETLKEEDVHALIIAGDEVITSTLNDEMHQEVSDKVIGHVRLDIDATDQELIDATLPVAERAERERELDTAKRAAGAAKAEARGAAGAAEVLRALQSGQVMTLVMNDDFAGTGWADFEMEYYDVGEVPKEHPMGGRVEDIVPMALEEELLRLAVRTDAEIDIVRTNVPIEDIEGDDVPDAGMPLPRTEAARILDELGGVAAVLRFDRDETA